MTEKVKTVIEFYFLSPDFKSRGHPTSDTSCTIQPKEDITLYVYLTTKKVFVSDSTSSPNLFEVSFV